MQETFVEFLLFRKYNLIHYNAQLWDILKPDMHMSGFVINGELILIRCIPTINRSWGDGSEMEITSCSSGGHELGSQHPCRQLMLMYPKIRCLLLTSSGTHTHTQKHRTDRVLVSS